ncbi:MAG: DUF4990 domain-containing protein [Paludibacteraceae bacterium]|nr:DUF4990 domain-containing protein [Paludibacteraceae bacterium]
MKKTLFVLCLVLAQISNISAATYYASPNGTGDGSSYASPTSWSAGLSATVGGDTLYLLEGEYRFDSKQTIGTNKNGFSQNKRTFIGAFPGEMPVIDFSAQPYGKEVTGSDNVGISISANTQYIHIKGLTIRYAGKNGLINYGSYNLIEDLDVYGCGDSGIQMKNGGNNTILNCDSHDNFDYKTTGTGGAANFGGNADGFADKQHSGAPNHYIGCRAWNNSDDGWDFFERVSTGTETIIENCICYQNGAPYYDMRNNPRAKGVDKAWFDSKVGTQMTDRYGNTITITLAKYPCQGNGNGFKMGGKYTDHNILIHHCLAVANNARGFDQNNNGGTMWVYNNTGYDNGVNFGFTTAYGTDELRNNISYASKNNDSYKAQTVGANDHNSWNNGFSVSSTDFQSLDTTLILAPRQADGSLPDNLFLKLANGSNLIDAGVNVGLSYNGDAPDLGCFESDGIIHPYIICKSNNLEQWIAEGDNISPIVFEWGGATMVTCTTLPLNLNTDITNNTYTISGSVQQEGTHSITVTTVSDDIDNPSLTVTLHVKSASAKRVAFVTVPGSASDSPLLPYLNSNDLISIVETDASKQNYDYSGFDAIVCGPMPASTAAGFNGLKGYSKPMLVLKPFLFKASVWNWGDSQNTADLSISVTDPTHVIFNGLTPDANGQLQLFSALGSQTKQYAVTGIASWYNTTGFTLLATPVSQSTFTSIADFPAGTDCNGTILSERLVMIGVSEYSTANLTNDGLRLIENAILYLLGISPTGIDDALSTQASAIKTLKDGQIVIIKNGKHYSTLGTQIK